jgi:hypothetical protein
MDLVARLKRHFEQVPLQAVREIVEEQNKRKNLSEQAPPKRSIRMRGKENTPTTALPEPGVTK